MGATKRLSRGTTGMQFSCYKDLSGELIRGMRLESEYSKKAIVETMMALGDLRDGMK